MKIHLYEHPNYEGRQVSLDTADPNLDNVHFSNKTSSIIIEDGRWQLFDRPNYGDGGAGSVVLKEGHYEDAESIGLPNNCISSLRPFPKVKAFTAQDKFNLLAIFAPQNPGEQLYIRSKVRNYLIGRGDYTSYEEYNVSIKGELDFDKNVFGNEIHLHGPFVVGINIADSNTCKLKFSSGSVNLDNNFSYKVKSKHDLRIEISDYKAGGNTYNGELIVQRTSSQSHGVHGAKITPDLTVTPDNGGDSEKLTHGIKITPYS